jgi:LexA-binding, inner membrane-associated putative hydrolase
MRSLPHVAIGCATVWVGERLLNGPSPSPANDIVDSSNGRSAIRDSRSLAESVDFRLVAAGSLLPDMVDRALRRIGVRTYSPHQHLIGHRLVFNVPLMLAGVSLMKRRRDPRLLAIAAAAFTHLLVDPVIRSPRTLLWPFLGREFPEARGLSRPLTAVTQVAAALTIGAAAFQLVRRGRLREFITHGHF